MKIYCRYKYFFLVSFVFGLASTTYAEVYKWVDSEGRTHFGDNAPDEVKSLDLSDVRVVNTLPAGDSSKPYGAENNFVQGSGKYLSKEQSISGRLLIDGEVISVERSEDVMFWIQDSNTHASTRINVKYDLHTGRYQSINIPPGDYSLTINVNKNRDNGTLYPGDYRGRIEFSITEAYSVKHDFNLEKMINILEPENNTDLVKSWGRCDELIRYPSPVTFSWLPTGRNLIYKYEVRRHQCEPFKYGDVVKSGSTRDTRIDLELPALESNHRYEFKIAAYRGDKVAATMVVHGLSGYSWGYSFGIL